MTLRRSDTIRKIAGRVITSHECTKEEAEQVVQSIRTLLDEEQYSTEDLINDIGCTIKN